MEYIPLGLVVLVALFVYTLSIGIFMKLANYVGQKLGIDKFFMKLCRGIRKYK